MDSGVSDSVGMGAPRRSTRLSSSKLTNYEATPRGPLKRTKTSSRKRSLVVVSNSRDLENGIEDDDSPVKKGRLEAEEDMARGDHDGVDLQRSEPMEINEDLEMDAGDDTSRRLAIPEPHMDRKVLPHVVITEHCRLPANEDIKENPITEGHVVSTKPSALFKAPHQRPDMSDVRITTMKNYKRKLEAKAMSFEIPTVNHPLPSVYPTPERPTTTRQRLNNIPLHKEHVQHQKSVIEETKKAAVIKERSGKSCRGWCLWPWIFGVLLICVTIFLASKFLPLVQRSTNGGDHSSRGLELKTFADQLSLLQTQFPSQRPELWRRSKIHLEKHLKTTQPTEPVSMIFTTGLGAERTLRCLAQGLAASFSSALNSSVLHIDGAGTAGKDSDQVKLDIDTQLQAAFEGDKPAAVIHRLEELPPGSTLIFYRYCDHENAAYKRVFLLFTVLLPQDVLGDEQSLREVEESVQDYLRERLVDSSDRVGYNRMDGDKYGGLWSRISHLILPVVSEKEVEQKGC